MAITLKRAGQNLCFVITVTKRKRLANIHGEPFSLSGMGQTKTPRITPLCDNFPSLERKNSQEILVALLLFHFQQLANQLKNSH